ncbi:MAG: heavy metal-associated domain-containing protein [Actinomycetota bacterium]|jgi:copper chaperone CopZ|nr:heavy metal-associated domain-containing protein [Actinomycetota bacterium]
MAVIKESYPIIGMECASCVKKIEDILKKTKGVISASANLASEKVTVEFDEETINKTELADILSRIGYDMIVE